MKVVVTRPAEGITINSEIEYLLDDSGEVQMFDSPEQARAFLIAAGIGLDELQHMTIMEA